MATYFIITVATMLAFAQGYGKMKGGMMPMEMMGGKGGMMGGKGGMMEMMPMEMMGKGKMMEMMPMEMMGKGTMMEMMPMDNIFSFMCMFCRSLFVLLSFFFWPLCCLFFFNLRILITPLVSSNSSYSVFILTNRS
jgi:hypothetical protein